MNFLTIFGITEIWCSFKINYKKTGKEIPKSPKLEFFERFLANNFALPDAEDKTLGLLNWGGMVDLPLLKTLAICQKPQEPGDFIAICKFGSFKNPFVMSTSLSEF